MNKKMYLIIRRFSLYDQDSICIKEYTSLSEAEKVEGKKNIEEKSSCKKMLILPVSSQKQANEIYQFAYGHDYSK